MRSQLHAQCRGGAQNQLRNEQFIRFWRSQRSPYIREVHGKWQTITGVLPQMEMGMAPTLPLVSVTIPTATAKTVRSCAMALVAMGAGVGLPPRATPTS